MNINLGNIIIKGGLKLSGTVFISGSKNSSLPILAASLLSNSTIKLYGMPLIGDIITMINILKRLGVVVTINNNSISINASSLRYNKIPSCLASSIRASILLIAPLLIKFKKVIITKPGGCNIGKRPIDLHLYGFKKLGAKVEESDKIIININKLIGNYINLKFPSVGATENLMIAACCAEGKTIINNAAKEPEIIDLAHFLIKLGANIKGAGTSTIEIVGMDQISTEIHHKIIPDRIEASTYMIIGAITNSDNFIVENCKATHLTSVINILRKIGVSIKQDQETLIINSSFDKNGIDVIASPYPGFPTDVQPLLAPLLAVIENEVSSITDTVFPNRFSYINELKKMGANIKYNNKILIKGVNKLIGNIVTATDLRIAASLVIAGLSADGITIIKNSYQLERGYENMYSKLHRLGAFIICN